jgi:hypothetical protein
MELKLEKKCKSAALKLGERYSLSAIPKKNTICIVSDIFGPLYRLSFFDGSSTITDASRITLYEFPLSPLEQELL